MTLGDKSTLLTGMDNGGHSTRTILLSQKEPGWLLASRGSDGNIDADAENQSTGHSQLKAFYIANVTSSSKPYDFTQDGRLMGWGLRNSVGVAEHPVTGGIFSVENSADQITRLGTDVHSSNPGEEMNFHGFLNSSTNNQGGNYGYPNCFAVWDTNIPNRGSLTVGDQFSIDRTGQKLTVDDATCNSQRVKPRLTFQSHSAPLDIKFGQDGQTAYVSFHGSWNSPNPVGYKVSSISFANGQPVAASDSTTAAIDLFRNQDLSDCPGACFRPVGLVVDSRGNIWVSSDATGEIWLLKNSAAPNIVPTGSNSGVSPATPSPSASVSTPSQEGGAETLRRNDVLAWGLFIFSILLR